MTASLWRQAHPGPPGASGAALDRLPHAYGDSGWMVFSRLRETFFSRATYVLQAPFVHTAEQHCTAAVHGSPHSRHSAPLPLSQNSDEQQSASVAQAPLCCGRPWRRAAAVRTTTAATVGIGEARVAILRSHLPTLTDVLTRIGSHPQSKIDELLPDRWQPAAV